MSVSQLPSLYSNSTVPALSPTVPSDGPCLCVHASCGKHRFVGLFVGCLTFQQHASVSQGRICSDNLTCCHTEIEVADQTFYPTQSKYTDTGPTSPSADPITPGAWQGSHGSVNFLSHWYDSTPKKSQSQAGFEPGIFRSGGGRLTTRPTRRSGNIDGPVAEGRHGSEYHLGDLSPYAPQGSTPLLPKLSVTESKRSNFACMGRKSGSFSK